MTDVVAIGDERALGGFALAGALVLAADDSVPAEAKLVIVTDETVAVGVPPDALVVVARP